MDLLPFELLRSVMRVGSEPESDVHQNLLALRNEVTPVGIDQHLLTYIGHLADKSSQVPTFQTVYAHYTHLNQQQDPSGQAGQLRLWEIENAGLPFLDPPAYRAELDRFREKVTGDTIAVMLQQTADILKQGHTPPAAKGKSKTFKGPDDAMVFMETGLTDLRSRFHSGDIEGSLRVNAVEEWQAYLDAQNRRNAGQPLQGVLTGFGEIDGVHDGAMAGELTLVVGFTSQFKSTFCYNWAYHAAVYQRKNVAIIPMEMSARSLLRLMAVRHCQHENFYDYDHPVFYDAVRRGALGPKQEAIFKAALDDLQTNTHYGTILYKEPQGVTTVGSIRRWAEQQHRQTPLDLLLIDYLGLVNPSTGDNSLRESAVANAAIREAKQLATSFASGRGIAMLSPWQASRDGYKEAEKNNGLYTLRALSWANEAERSSDFVYSVYIDTSTDSQLLKFGNLKARDRQLLTGTHDLWVLPAARLVSTPGKHPAQQAVKQGSLI